MNPRPPTKAERAVRAALGLDDLPPDATEPDLQIVGAMGSRPDRYRVRVTGTRRHGGRPAVMRTFGWDSATGWAIDVRHLAPDRFDGDEPEVTVGKATSAMPSRRHARLGQNRNTVHFADGVDIGLGVLAVILDAAREAQIDAIPLDGVKLAVSQLGSYIAKLGGLDPHERRRAMPTLYKEILKRCVMVD
jgi:hypothetical protein